jgi:5-methylcytosine-specific restriction endonuclease McrA
MMAKEIKTSKLELEKTVPYIPPIPKPYQKEGLVLSMTRKEQRSFRAEQFRIQKGICACGCGRPMSLIQFLGNSAVIEHKVVQPMGHPKNWARSNLQLMRSDCNFQKGSKRDYKPKTTSETPSPSDK